MKVTCIIPFFNEGDRILQVLRELNKSAYIDQFVCVDDGSSDDAYLKIQEEFPNIDLLRLSPNKGKSEAVKQGLSLVRWSFVLLMDADLQNLNYKEIEIAIQFMFERPRTDMVIFRRVNSPKYLQINKIDVLISGERLLKTSDLKAICEKKFKNYQIEMAINQYMINNKKTTYWSAHSALNTRKYKKHGSIKGSIKDVQMLFNIFPHVGLKNFIVQFFTFAREPIQ